MHKEIVDFLNSSVAESKATFHEAQVGDHSIFIEPTSILEVCNALKNSQWEFNVLQVITGCDYSDRIEVSYILASYTHNHEVIVKAKLPKKSPEAEVEIDSVCSVWIAANFQERECFDMVGVKFNGHPDHRRILCPDDWEGYPLRKDYVVQETYKHMTVNPAHKVNTEDHFFGDRLKRNSDEPKKVSVSWKIPEFPATEENKDA